MGWDKTIQMLPGERNLHTQHTAFINAIWQTVQLKNFTLQLAHCTHKNAFAQLFNCTVLTKQRTTQASHFQTKFQAQEVTEWKSWRRCRATGVPFLVVADKTLPAIISFGHQALHPIHSEKLHQKTNNKSELWYLWFKYEFNNSECSTWFLGGNHLMLILGKIWSLRACHGSWLDTTWKG